MQKFTNTYIWSRPPAVSPPHAMVPPGPGPGTLGPSMRLSIFPLFPHLVESPANTIGFSTCEEYDPYQPSITPTHGHPTHPAGGARGNHDHHRGGGGGGAQDCAIYTIYIYITFSKHTVYMSRPLRENTNPVSAGFLASQKTY